MMAFVAMLLWGIAYVPSAWVLEDWPPLASAAVRLGIAGVLLIALRAALGRPWRPSGGWALIMLALTQTSIFYGAVYWGITREGAGVSAVLSNTDPLFIAVLAAIFLAEPLTGRQWVGLVVGFVGAAIAASSNITALEFSWDAVILIIGAFAWSVGTVCAARQVRQKDSASNIAGWQMAIGATALMAASFIWEEPLTWTMPPLAWSIFGAVLSSAVPTVLFYWALNRGPAGELSALFFLVPVVGIATAWPFLGEEPTVELAIGATAVAVGVVMVMWPTPSRLLASSGNDERPPGA